MTINDFDTLYMEKQKIGDDLDCIPGSSWNLFDYEMAVGLGFRFESNSVYGLAERESSLYI